MRRIVHHSGLAKLSLGFRSSWYSNFRKIKFVSHHSKSIYYYKPQKLKQGLEQAEGRLPVQEEYKKYFICHDTTYVSDQEKSKIMRELLLSNFYSRYPKIKVDIYNPKLHDGRPYVYELLPTHHIFAGDSNENNDLIAVTLLGEDILLSGYE